MPRLLPALPLLVLLWMPPTLAPADEPQYPAILVAPTDPLPAEEQLKKFHLPPGFTIQLVACEPQIHKPMNLNFDGGGRMYVTSSLEYPFPVKPGETGRDIVSVLEDRDGDGRAESVKTLLTGLNIPIGVTPVAGGVIYHSIPNIYLWQGDPATAPPQPGGSGAKESRLLYPEIGFRDTHGMTNSFTRWVDGWIYCSHGFANDSTVRSAGGEEVRMNSGNTFRIRADGSHIEQVTHGQVNPFGLCFDPLGNEYSADCHTLPIYQLLRGAWYPSFGKPHDGLGYGPAMIGHNHGSTGIAGVVYYAADHFPPEYRDTVFIGNPVTGKVNHDRLEAHGSSYNAIEQPDFVRCDDPWFRPVDLKLAPDGSLYILDFYNKIIGHYEVPLKHPGRDRFRGRIWRVVYTGVDGGAPPPRPMPDLARLSTEQLLERLGDPNLTVRVLATEELVSRPDAPTAEQLLPDDTSEADAWRRAHGLWIVERTAKGGLSEDQIERLADDPARIVRVHLIKALAERPEWTTGKLDLAALVRDKLSDSDAFVRRAAADALGRHPQAESVEPLLSLWAATPADDTHLVHVVRMSLRDHLRASGMYAEVRPSTTSNADFAARLADVSLGVRSPDAAEYLFAWLSDRGKSSDRLPEFARETARWLPETKLPELCDWAENRGQDSLPLARELALALHRSAQERKLALPESFVAAATRTGESLLAEADKPLVQSGIDLAREMRLKPLFEQLAALASPETKFADLRAGAIDACIVNDAERSIPLLSGILGNAVEPAALRQKAAAALASINSEAARQELVMHLRLASDRLAIEIAVGLAARKPGAELLLAEISAGKASPRLLQEAAVQERLRAANVQDLEERLAQLTAGLPPADERIKQLLTARRDGFRETKPDAALGKAVFQKTCAACHRVSGAGGKVGPDLDGVGLRGVDRLLEDVLDPSRNVDQAFRSTVLNTVDGQSISGLLLRNEGAVLVLTDNQGKEIRIPESDVEERAITALSPMPGNVADLVPEADFYHLLAYLLEQRQAPPSEEAAKPEK
ncbi:MAG TPA: HEAT repeat domain-containing protein [Pirellulales bacterium]|nr:HEAT repeat domain-containing protein [Pirellulales bacterium]